MHLYTTALILYALYVRTKPYKAINNFIILYIATALIFDLPAIEDFTYRM